MSSTYAHSLAMNTNCRQWDCQARGRRRKSGCVCMWFVLSMMMATIQINLKCHISCRICHLPNKAFHILHFLLFRLVCVCVFLSSPCCPVSLIFVDVKFRSRSLSPSLRFALIFYRSSMLYLRQWMCHLGMSYVLHKSLFIVHEISSTFSFNVCFSPAHASSPLPWVSECEKVFS